MPHFSAVTVSLLTKIKFDVGISPSCWKIADIDNLMLVFVFYRQSVDFK